MKQSDPVRKNDCIAGIAHVVMDRLLFVVDRVVDMGKFVPLIFFSFPDISCAKIVWETIIAPVMETRII